MTLSKARFVFLFPFFLQVVLVNVVLRVLLFHLEGTYSWGEIPEILFWGLTQDFLFFCFFALPVVVYLWWTPQDVFVTTSNKGTLYFFNAVSSLYLSSAAVFEYYFWGLHHSRFNEHLNSEFFTNVSNQHSIVLILLVVFALTLFLWTLFYRLIRYYLKQQKMVFSSFRFRLLPAFVFILLPCLIIYFFHYKKHPTMPVESHWAKEQLKANGSLQILMTKTFTKIPQSQN